MTVTETVLMGVAALVTALIVWWLLRRDPRRRDLVAPPAMLQPRIAVPTTSLPPQLEDEVRGLTAERQLILAIKRVREETGLGLKEAKDLVEAIRAGGTPV